MRVHRHQYEVVGARVIDVYYYGVADLSKRSDPDKTDTEVFLACVSCSKQKTKSFNGRQLSTGDIKLLAEGKGWEVSPIAFT